MESIHDPRYTSLIEELVRIRKSQSVSQEELAERLKEPQSFVSKVETRERRIDLIELVDWCNALGCNLASVLGATGLIPPNYSVEETDRSNHSVAVPIAGSAKQQGADVTISLGIGAQKYSITLGNTKLSEYQAVDSILSKEIRSLNTDGRKNREVIADCLLQAISKMPSCNPSDVYHHVVYRTFLREYTKSDPNQSWVRAGGEAVELFVEKLYKERLSKLGIVIKALIGKDNKQAAIDEMGLSGEVSSSKLDIALWGTTADGKKAIFGGIHIKASLAERVSDDIPCSKAMMAKGYLSILFTFDAKSFPPPHGDLVNRGEFGSVATPSDKRIYIESHGAFDVAMTYNTRIEESPAKTKSGKRVIISNMKPSEDKMPLFILNCWKAFAQSKGLKTK